MGMMQLYCTVSADIITVLSCGVVYVFVWFRFILFIAVIMSQWWYVGGRGVGAWMGREWLYGNIGTLPNDLHTTNAILIVWRIWLCVC